MNLAQTLFVSLGLTAVPVLAQHLHHAGMHGAPHASPYVGQQTREIKALSPQEQRGWLEGQGMGLARAAELNGYPGPMHVLEHAAALRLTESQAAATRALMDAHKAQVRSLGAQLVEAERELDALLRDKTITEEQLRQRVEAIARLQGQIRASHLVTHLRQTKILDAAQVAQYNKLRGYE